MTTIPHRFSEAQFRRYETYINHVIEAYPQAIKADPALFDVSTATFIARFRDAMKSYHDHNWNSRINRDRFELAYPQIQVIHRTDGTILIGPRMAVQKWGQTDKVADAPLSIDNAAPDTILNLLTPDAKDLIMLLSHTRWLAPRIRVRGLSTEEVEKFHSQYDIAIDNNNDGTFTII